MTAAPDRQFKVLLTAQNAFPELERQFLQAQTEIIAGFRIFDPWTKLHTAEAKAFGDTWFDLIVATLNRDVKVTFILCDFDPVLGAELHMQTWDSIRAMAAAAEVSRNPHLLSARASLHPARVGWLPRLLLWPRVRKEVASNLSGLNNLPRDQIEHRLRSAPHFRDLVKWKGESVVPRLRPPPLVPVTHHQKLAVFDDETLYVGGLDLNDRRYDTPQHRRDADETWHDTQVLVTGPVAQEAAQHLRNFEAVTYGKPALPTRHLLRTISAKRRIALPFLSPKPVINELAQMHHAQIDQSERLIYLESQFFRDRTLAKHLAKRARANADLTLILILPAAPEEAAFYDKTGSDVAYGEYLQTKSIEIVEDAFGDRLFVGSPAQPRDTDRTGRDAHYNAPIIYLHAKVSIFDDRLGLVSSANLNGRSMAWDTEIGVATQSADEVQSLKNQSFDHWLGPDAGPEFYDVKTACAVWAAQARRNTALTPKERSGFILPYAKEPAAELGYDLPGVPEEIV